jgi:hypothetical protein
VIKPGDRSWWCRAQSRRKNACLVPTGLEVDFPARARHAGDYSRHWINKRRPLPRWLLWTTMRRSNLIRAFSRRKGTTVGTRSPNCLIL